MNDLCKCGHVHHSDYGGHVCFTPSCLCTKFIEATTEDIQRDSEKLLHAAILKHVIEYRTTTDRIKYLLAHEESLRNMRNAEFEDWFRANIDPKTNPDTIRRCKQKLVAADRDRYGPTDPNLVRHKYIREEATKQWLETG